MKRFHWKIAKSFCRNEAGAVAVEYAIIAVAMFMAIMPAFLLVTSAVQAKFEDVAGFFDAIGS